MHRPAIDDAVIEAVAADTAFAPGDVKIGLRTLHDAVRDRLSEEFASARDPESTDHLLLDGPDATWFALGVRELESAVEAAGYEVDDELLATAAATNLRAFQEEEGRTVSYTKDRAETDDAPLLYPVRVNKPESWKAAGIRALETVVDLIDADVPPTAALDAWAVESMGVPAANWADRRGVDEAVVREAVSRAREHRETPGGRVAPADDVTAPQTDAVSADSVYDPETGRVVVPTDANILAGGAGGLFDGGGGGGGGNEDDRGVAGDGDGAVADNGDDDATAGENGDPAAGDAVATDGDGGDAGNGSGADNGDSDTEDDSGTDGDDGADEGAAGSGVATDGDIAASIPDDFSGDIGDDADSTGET